jgi:hypothetical protein
MGLNLPNNNDSLYYVANGDHGQYAFVYIQDVIDAFVASYIGPGKICEGVLVEDAGYWAQRGMQELSYDTLHSYKAHEYIVPPSLTMFLPRDFVNYVKFTWSDSKGVEHAILPARITSNPTDIGYDATTDAYSFTGNVLDTDETSDTLTNYNTMNTTNASDDYDWSDPLHELNRGQRYGMDPEFSNVNGTFHIDYKTGKVHFSSNLNGMTVIIKYISDGLNNTDHDANGPAIHKFAEEALMKYIVYNCLAARAATPPHLLAGFKKELFAEKRKAKLRLSNFKLEEFAQILRGKSKQIKH